MQQWLRATWSWRLPGCPAKPLTTISAWWSRAAHARRCGARASLRWTTPPLKCVASAADQTTRHQYPQSANNSQWYGYSSRVLLLSALCCASMELCRSVHPTNPAAVISLIDNKDKQRNRRLVLVKVYFRIYIFTRGNVASASVSSSPVWTEKNCPLRSAVLGMTTWNCTNEKWDNQTLHLICAKGPKPTFGHDWTVQSLTARNNAHVPNLPINAKKCSRHQPLQNVLITESGFCVQTEGKPTLFTT